MKRHFAMSIATLLSLGLAACSSGSGTSVQPSRPGVAVLGAKTTVWRSGHATTSDAGSGPGYGTSVTIDGHSVPQSTSVKESDGRVVGWTMTFPAGTRLASAEKLIRAQLPLDARQTASWRGSFGTADSHCEFVNFQSATLAGSLGTATPSASQDNIGVEVYEITPHRSGLSSIAIVNSAVVNAKPNVLGQGC